MSCAKTAEPIEMTFEMLSLVGPWNHVLDGRVHGHNLANTIEPSMSGGDATLCQITLTTCLNTVTDVQHANMTYADACLRCLRTLVCRRSASCVDIIFSVSSFFPLLFANLLWLKPASFLSAFTLAVQYQLSM